MAGPDLPDRAQLSAEDRRRVTRASFLKPLNLIVLAAGAGAFVATGSFWFVPLTLVTYAVLVLLAARDPIFERQVLSDRSAGRSARIPSHTPAPQVSPERRARWLPRGETRQKVEDALGVYRKVLAAIEGADDVTRAVLEDAIPKLHAAADRLVDVAHKREKAAAVIDEARTGTALGPDTATIRELESEVRNADAEISASFEKLAELRSRVVRVSLETGSSNRATATELNESLDELNLRLEALGDTMSPAPDDPPSRSS
jgi:hypothetical protein